LSSCPQCGNALAPGALVCPNCHALVHANELSQFAEQARVATSNGRLADARHAWEQALALLPPDSVQYATIRQTIAALSAQIAADPPSSGGGGAAKGASGAAGAIGLLSLLGKGKFLLFGLAKIKTLFSMLAFLGVYWALYGWKFALGFVISIYIHEMGHVAELARFGIPASAPMFIPFLGAVVRMKAYPATPHEDARVGLAGPVWGLGAALVALAFFLITREPYWAAIARVGAWLNLFNLIPVWQLDGGRGFHALTRTHRLMVAIAAGALAYLTSEGMLVLIAIGAIYRLFTKDFPEHEDTPILIQFVGLLAVLSVVYLIAVHPK
jgi:Zn-dependent proteases